MKPKQFKFPGYHCFATDSQGKKCGHEWISRMNHKKPIQCPKCKSRTWERGKKP